MENYGNIQKIFKEDIKPGTYNLLNSCFISALTLDYAFLQL